MKKTVVFILLSAISLAVLTSCGSKVGVKTKNRTYIKANGGGYCYVFDIDEASSCIKKAGHSNLVQFCNFNKTTKDEIHLIDVYACKDGFEGEVKVSKATGNSGFDSPFIPNGTTLKINNNNLYFKNLRNGNKKVYLNNAKIKFTTVGQSANTKGTASFNFDLPK